MEQEKFEKIYPLIEDKRVFASVRLNSMFRFNSFGAVRLPETVEVSGMIKIHDYWQSSACVEFAPEEVFELKIKKSPNESALVEMALSPLIRGVLLAEPRWWVDLEDITYLQTPNIN